MYAMAYPGPSKPPQALLLKDVLERLEKSRDKIEIQWDPESEEHWFADLDGTRIWLPTQKVCEMDMIDGRHKEQT